MTLVSGRDERKDTPVTTADKKTRPREKDMGAALRSVYQKAVDEDVPDELLDLLKKLD